MDKYQQLEKRIQELETWKREKEQQQFRLPLDVSSMRALVEAFRDTKFGKVNSRSFILTTGNTDNPIFEGQIVYHSTTPSLKVLLGGVVKTITVT